MNYKKILKKALIILVDVLVYTFLVASLVFALFSISSKKSVDGAVQVFGYEVRTVITDSMANCPYTDVSNYKIKSIPTNSLIFIKRAPDNEQEKKEWYSSLSVGDVLTINYVYVRQVVITHRIVKITEKETGGYIIELSGDNKDSNSVPLRQVIDTSLTDSPNNIIGKVTGQSKFLGAIVTYLSNPLTAFLCIILPCAVIIMHQVFKIMLLKVTDKLSLREKEIEELKAELESVKNIKILQGGKKT